VKWINHCVVSNPTTFELLRQNPRQAPKLCMLIGFVLFALSFVHLNNFLAGVAGLPEGR
jgi:hypothetical protein